MRYRLSVILLLLTAIVGVGCGAQVEGVAADSNDQASRAQQTATEEVRVPVEAGLPQRGDMSAYFETTARIMAETRVEVIAKGMGQALDVKVEEGDKVEKGQVLAELDKEELQAQLQQSRVNVAQTKYQMETTSEQYTKGVLSEYESKMARFNYDTAVSNLRLLEVQMKNQTIRAPISGIITQRMIQPGMLISSGMPTYSIMDPTSFVLPISPPEKEVRRLSIGQEARVSIDSNAGNEVIATVKRINPAVDVASGTVKVTLAFAEKDLDVLREAAFARVRLVMETHEDTLIVPKDTLIEENGRYYLMTVVEEPLSDDIDPSTEPRYVAERIEVETGLEDANYIEITSGLSDDSLIVTLGQHTLKVGAAIRVTNAEEEILSKAGISAEEALERSKAKRFDIGNGKDRREKLIR